MCSARATERDTQTEAEREREGGREGRQRLSAICIAHAAKAFVKGPGRAWPDWRLQSQRGANLG